MKSSFIMRANSRTTIGGICCALVVGLLALSNGCKPATHAAADRAAAPDVMLREVPRDPVDVRQIREQTVDIDNPVTVVGRIGGRVNPFVDGRMAFTIVDRSLDYCPPEERCPTPWDYCCDPALTRANSALVIVVDSEDQPIQQDAQKTLKLKPLMTVFAQGAAQIDEHGNLVVRAHHIFVEELGTAKN